MGIAKFLILVPGADDEEAFDAAREDALEEYGSDRYSGTIAAKTYYVIIEDVPQDYQDGLRQARAWLREHDDLPDTDGPAGAIAVRNGPESDEAGWLFFGHVPY